MASERILVIDDDAAIIKALGMFLRHEGMNVDSALTGAEGLRKLEQQAFDLVLLDLDLPDIDGFGVLGRLRSAGNTTPVIIVSGHDEEYNQLVGLGSGADDYVTKPFSVLVLLSKARALIRRSSVYAGASEAASGTTLTRGPFTLMRDTYRLTKNGELVSLTSRELALLTCLMEHPGRVYSKAQLYEAVWDNPVVDENTVMVYVKRLRDKIEDDPAHPVYLRTLRGIGYAFECE